MVYSTGPEGTLIPPAPLREVTDRLNAAAC